MKNLARARPFQALLIAMVVGGGGARLEAAMGVSLASSPPDPAPVGTMIAWKAQVSDALSGDLWYRFRVRGPGGTFRMIRDYGPVSTLDWTSIDEGLYELEVSVRDRGAAEIATTTSAFELESRVRSGQAVTSATAHPLVVLFSSPGCESGRASVQFQSAGGPVQSTPFQPCVAGRSLNFYLAGLAPGASGSARLTVERGRDAILGPAVPFQTGAAPANLTAPSAVETMTTPDSQRILLQSLLNVPAIATDVKGKLVWFGPSPLTYITHPEAGGTFFGLLQSKTDPAQEVVRRFDLVGMTVQETNAARVNEQLAAQGKRTISGFHHEARALSGGKTLVMGMVEQMLTDVQGPGPIDVIGDVLLVLDADLQVVWSWDTFDHLDVSRRAVMGETCKANGCDHHYLSPDGNDWTHGNSAVDTPDGALLYSARHQDWVIKIDYRDGAGNGDVIWRLGKDGDFTYDSTDPYPWFSHQHDAAYEPGSRSTIALFDNANTRRSVKPGSTSRGQTIVLDEKRRIARLDRNLDLGIFSSALGSAQKLRDGTWHFDAGFVFDAGSPTRAAAFSLQVDGSNNVLWSMKLLRPVYRSFRLDDLYGPMDAPAPRDSATVDFHE